MCPKSTFGAHSLTLYTGTWRGDVQSVRIRVQHGERRETEGTVEPAYGLLGFRLPVDPQGKLQDFSGVAASELG